MTMIRNLRPYERAMRRRIARAETLDDLRRVKTASDILVGQGVLIGEEHMRLETLIEERAAWLSKKEGGAS